MIVRISYRRFLTLIFEGLPKLEFRLKRAFLERSIFLIVSVRILVSRYILGANLYSIIDKSIICLRYRVVRYLLGI